MVKTSTFALAIGDERNFSFRIKSIGYKSKDRTTPGEAIVQTNIIESVDGNVKDALVQNLYWTLKHSNISVVDGIVLPNYNDIYEDENYLIVAAENAFLMLNNFTFNLEGSIDDFIKKVTAQRDAYYRRLQKAFYQQEKAYYENTSGSAPFPIKMGQIDDKEGQTYKDYKKLLKIYREFMLNEVSTDVEAFNTLLNSLFLIRQKYIMDGRNQADDFIKRYSR
jgi:hypothetical protein